MNETQTFTNTESTAPLESTFISYLTSKYNLSFGTVNIPLAGATGPSSMATITDSHNTTTKTWTRQIMANSSIIGTMVMVNNNDGSRTFSVVETGS